MLRLEVVKQAKESRRMRSKNVYITRFLIIIAHQNNIIETKLIYRMLVTFADKKNTDRKRNTST